jgi:NADH:ubiquinone oxidoreductase subunit 4 (subunit M)
MIKCFWISFFSLYNDMIFFILVLSLVGFTYASMVAFSQIDIKKLIAYSSIAHMNFSVIGLFSQTLIGLSGVFIMMLGHAITSGALFLGIGVLYDRYKTRIVFYYGSLATFMPIFSILYFLFVLSNFGFPGTSNFVGEFFILVGSVIISNVIVFLSALAMILSLIYSLFFYSRIFFGMVPKYFIRYFCDLIRLEFIILVVFSFLVLICGIYPQAFIDFFNPSLLKFSIFYI